MADMYAKRNGEVDTPHRHNFFTLLLIQEAKGRHIIDFNEYPLGANRIFFISPGQVHQVREEEPSQGYSMLFSTQFLVQNNIPLSFINDLNLFNDFGESPPLMLDTAEVEKMVGYANEIFDIQQSDMFFKYEAMGALLKLMLIYCNNNCSLPNEMASHNKNSALSEFKSLIDSNHKVWHSTTEYANALNITPDHLNRLVKSQTGKTAKEHIQSRIIVAAKRLLYFTDLSNKEIGFELGFSEPGNFSAFFKKCVGQSPSQFQSAY